LSYINVEGTVFYITNYVSRLLFLLKEALYFSNSEGKLLYVLPPIKARTPTNSSKLLTRDLATLDIGLG
jgi:hypothetical protein